MEKTKKLFWIFTSAEHLYSFRLFQDLWFKKKIKFDCSEFGAVEINRAVDNTYRNYQSLPYNFKYRIFYSPKITLKLQI